MKKITLLILLTLPVFAFSQTWDFTNTDDGWVNVAATKSSKATYWELTSKVGVNNPGLKITASPSIDATAVSILAITMKNISASGPEIVRASAVIAGGTNPGTIYLSVDISKGDTEYKTYYIDFSGQRWDGGGTVGETKILFKAAGNTNFSGTGSEVFDIDKIEMLSSIPTVERQAYHFDNDGDAEDWDNDINGTMNGVSGGVLTFTPTADKYAKLGLNAENYHVNSSSASTLNITLKNNTTGDDQLRIILSGGTVNIDISDSVGSGIEHSYSALLAGIPGWTEDVSDISIGFRDLDNPTTVGWSSGGGTFVINSIAFDNTLAVEKVNFKDDSSIELFPNPVQRVLKVTTKTNVKRVEVYNLLGQKILVQENSNLINVKKLLKGTYITKIYQENNNISTKRFIKK